MYPKVAVIIPTHNDARYIGTTLDSLCDQDFDDFDVVLADDGSMDQTIAIAESFSDRLRLTLLRASLPGQASGGGSWPRNKAIENSTADVFFFLDSDDLFDTNYLASCLNAWRQAEDSSVMFTGYRTIDDDGRASPGLQLSDYSSLQTMPKKTVGPDLYQLEGRSVFSALLRGSFLRPSYVAVRREAIEDVGFFDTSLTNSQDWDLWLRLASADNRFLWLNQILTSYRHRAGSISNRGVEKLLSNKLKVLSKQLDRGLSTSDTAAARAKMAEYLDMAGWQYGDKGDVGAAIRAYGRAFQLNPRSRYLRGSVVAMAKFLLGRH